MCLVSTVLHALAATSWQRFICSMHSTLPKVFTTNGADLFHEAWQHPVCMASRNSRNPSTRFFLVTGLSEVDFRLEVVFAFFARPILDTPCVKRELELQHLSHWMLMLSRR
jgi:hypothetical protein